MKSSKLNRMITLLGLCLSANAFGQGLYAAIGYSPTNGSWGRAWGQPSYAAAESNALAQCYNAGGVDCQLASWVMDGCASLAKDSEGYWGASFANGVTFTAAYSPAQWNAIEACQKYSVNGGCAVVTTVCSF